MQIINEVINNGGNIDNVCSIITQWDTSTFDVCSIITQWDTGTFDAREELYGAALDAYDDTIE